MQLVSKQADAPALDASATTQKGAMFPFSRNAFLKIGLVKDATSFQPWFCLWF